MPSDGRRALTDILEHIGLARQWLGDLTLEAFAEDRRTLYAVTRCLEIISEASRRLPQSMIDRSPHLPWRRIRDAGNVYRHQYDNVLEENVFHTVRQGLTDLERFVQRELGQV